METVRFQSSDGTQLHGKLITRNRATGITVIHGATGVPYDYYLPFAEWLSDHRSNHVLIYAYRDSDNPTADQLRKSSTNMADWGLKDQSAALDFAISVCPDLPVHTIGHSLGGFCIPFHPAAGSIHSHIAVNSGLAYWRSHPWSYFAQVLLFWFALGPVATYLLGYLPGRILGTRTGIPANVFWQWRKWCTHPDFHAVEWGKELPVPDLEGFTGSLKLVSCSDDVMITTNRVWELERFFPAAKDVQKLRLSPGEHGLRSIGHIRIFSRSCSKIWPFIVD